MGQKISIPSQNQPFRRQSSLGGNVSFRNVSGNEDNSFVTLARVTKVYYKQGKIDFKLTNTNIVAEDSTNDGSGSAPIPVDFFGKRANGQVFGHYRPIKIGDLIAVAYLNGHKTSPIVIGVYPTSSPDYEIISPSFYDAGNDEDDSVAETGLAEEKVYPSMQTEYRSGSGTIAKALNGHSFLTIDDETANQYNQLWASYDNVGFFSHNGEITNPLKEKAGDWLLVHEDNPNASGNGHRTRFYVNQDGNVQIVLMGNDSAGDISVFEGSRENGFSIKHYQGIKSVKSGDLGQDVYRPDFDSATKYVEMNIGKDESVLLQALDGNKNTNLSVNPDGVYINGKLISEIIYNAGNKNDQKISDITNDIDDINQHLADKDKSDAQKDQDLQKKWADYEQRVADNAKAASDAAKSAEQAGDDAKAAGQAAVRAGDNAVSLTDDIKNKIIYYSSISKEKDVHIPGKYLIINTDTYIANGTIKTAYIEDGAISSAKIGNEAVGTAQIARAAVGTLQVADGAIGTAQIKDLAVTDEKVGNLTFNHMIGQTLDANKIKVKNISGDEISADTITANHLKIGSLSEISGDLGNIIKGNISASDDPNKGVVINGLDADDPDKYTASKKAALFREVNALNASYQATLAYAQSVGIDATALQQAQQAMSDGLSPLFMNMGETTTMDHNKVVELEKALQQAISDIQNQFRYQLGTTANGKSTIYSGSQQPAHPKENDLWMKDTGSGTDIEIYNGAGWVSPSLNVVNNMNTALKNMPKTFFQSAQPDPKTTQLNEGDLWYKLTKDSNGNFVYTYYKWDNSVHMWVKLLNNGEVTNQSDINDLKNNIIKNLSDQVDSVNQGQQANQNSINDLKNNIIKNLSDQVDSVNQGQQANQNSINDLKNNIIKNLADTVNQNEQTSQNNYKQLTGQIKTAQTNAINTANANTANQINGIQIGGRNLVRNTNTDIVIDDTGNTGTRGWYFAIINLTQQLKVGDQITVSAEGTLTGRGDLSTYDAILYDPNTTFARSDSKRLTAGKRSSATITVTNLNGTGDTVLLIYAGNISDTEGKKNVVHHLKVEFGNKATDWSPAPEDQTAYTDTKVGQVQNNLNNLNTDYQAKVKLLDSINGKVDKITGSVVLLDTNYDGIMISPKTGIVNTTTGNTNTVNTVLSGDHGFLISKTPNKAGSATEDIFHVDTDGNLTIKGDFVGGNISGVNFTGANLNLAGSMKVSGSILAGDDGKGNAKVVINNNGLNMTSGDINLGDDKGTYVHIDNDGTLTANQANISGNITATKLLLNDPTGNGQSSINLGGKFMVDSQGTVTANKFNSTNITVTGGEIKGTTINGNYIKGGTIHGTTMDSTTIYGGTINGSSIIGGKFSSDSHGASGVSLIGYNNRYVGGYISSGQTPNFYVTSSGSLLATKVIKNSNPSIGSSGKYGNTNFDYSSYHYIHGNSSAVGGFYYYKIGTFKAADIIDWNKSDNAIEIIYQLGALSDGAVYNGSSYIGFTVMDNTFNSSLYPSANNNYALMNEIHFDSADDEEKLLSKGGNITFTDTGNNRYNACMSEDLMHLYGSLGDTQYASVNKTFDYESTYEIGAIVYLAANDPGFSLNILDISTRYAEGQLSSFYNSEVSPAGTISLVHGNYTLNTNETNTDKLLHKSAVERTVIMPHQISITQNEQNSYHDADYNPTTNKVELSPMGIGFSYYEHQSGSNNRYDLRVQTDGYNSRLTLGSGARGIDNPAIVYTPTGGDGYDTGLNIYSAFQIVPPGADHGIRFAWVSYSSWDQGERYPVIINSRGSWGGVAFPKSSEAFIFDAFGNTFWPAHGSVNKGDNYGSYGWGG